MRPVASIPALWALSVELLRAVGEALRPKHGVNPVLEAEGLPAWIIYIGDGINNVSLWVQQRYPSNKDHKYRYPRHDQ